MSATQFIRMIKLKRAVQMLNNPDYFVSEILYEVGFTNPSSFPKCFKKQFEISPTQCLLALFKIYSVNNRP